MKKLTIVLMLLVICLVSVSCTDENDRNIDVSVTASCAGENDGNVDVSVTVSCADENDGNVDVSVTGYFLKAPKFTGDYDFFAELGISENKELYEYVTSKDHLEKTSYNKNGNNEVRLLGSVYSEDPDRTFTFLETEYDLWYIETVSEISGSALYEYEIYRDIHGNEYHFLTENGEFIYYENNSWKSGFRSERSSARKKAQECMELLFGENSAEYVYLDWDFGGANNYFHYNKKINGILTFENVTVSLGLDGTLEEFFVNGSYRYENIEDDPDERITNALREYVSEYEIEVDELYSFGFSEPVLFKYQDDFYLYVTGENRFGTVYYFFGIE